VQEFEEELAAAEVKEEGGAEGGADAAGLGHKTKIFSCSANMSFENSKYSVPQEHQPDENNFEKIIYDSFAMPWCWAGAMNSSLDFRELMFFKANKSLIVIET
jgi:hypothetical protein